MDTLERTVRRAHCNEKIARYLITICGIGTALVPFLIGAFLLVKGTDTCTLFGHTLGEFFFSGQWNPSDTAEGGGHVGAAMFLSGSLVTCGLGLLLSLPLSLFTAIFMTEIATPRTQRMIQPAVELFTGIPSVVYGWIGLTVLVPFLRAIFPMPYGFSVLAAACVLAVMIFPTITAMASDAMKAVPFLAGSILWSWCDAVGNDLSRCIASCPQWHLYRYHPGSGPSSRRSTGRCYGHWPDESIPDVPFLASQHVDDCHCL